MSRTRKNHPAGFISFNFTNVLKENGIKISMDGKGRWRDNVFIKRLWRSLKYECVHLNAFDNGLQTRKKISAWLSHYNQTRPHSTHHGQTPDEVYNKAQIYEGHAPHKWKEAA